MSYLKMALAALPATAGVGEAGAQRCDSTRQSPAPQQHVLICVECAHFEINNGPNPRQGWGKCRLKQNKGRYGCATACEKNFNS
jgi:hypothetical protein